MPELMENWLALGLLATAAWAASCIVDACFVGRGDYRYPSEGVVVTGLFSLLPLPLLMQEAALNTMVLRDPGASAAVLGGACYMLHVDFYFRALFWLNDASSAEIFNTLCVLLVPLFAFFLLGEGLPGRHYLALTLALSGVIVLVGRQLGRPEGRAVVELALAVVFLSAAMVLQARAYQALNFATASFLFLTFTFASALLTTVSSGVQQSPPPPHLQPVSAPRPGVRAGSARRSRGRHRQTIG